MGKKKKQQKMEENQGEMSPPMEITNKIEGKDESTGLDCKICVEIVSEKRKINQMSNDEKIELIKKSSDHYEKTGHITEKVGNPNATGFEYNEHELHIKQSKWISNNRNGSGSYSNLSNYSESGNVSTFSKRVANHPESYVNEWDETSPYPQPPPQQFISDMYYSHYHNMEQQYKSEINGLLVTHEAEKAELVKNYEAHIASLNEKFKEQCNSGFKFQNIWYESHDRKEELEKLRKEVEEYKDRGG